MKANVSIKPLGVNRAFQGRRFRTKEYLQFEKDCLFLLPAGKVPTKQNLTLYLEFGFSNKLADIDGPVKLVTDILQKKYGFNDNQIYTLMVQKRIVKKGQEYWFFQITEQ